MNAAATDGAAALVWQNFLPESPVLVFPQVIGFSSETVAAFIGVVGILSILAQVRSSFCPGFSSLVVRI